MMNKLKSLLSKFKVYLIEQDISGRLNLCVYAFVVIFLAVIVILNMCKSCSHDEVLPEVESRFIINNVSSINDGSKTKAKLLSITDSLNYNEFICVIADEGVSIIQVDKEDN